MIELYGEKKLHRMIVRTRFVVLQQDNLWSRIYALGVMGTNRIIGVMGNFLILVQFLRILERSYGNWTSEILS